MAYQSVQDVVSGEQYRYALQNFRIAHEKVEEQRRQLEEQERQVASLRAHIALLEGEDHQHNRSAQSSRQGSDSVDDFSIRNSANRLEKQVNRWAADVVRTPPGSLNDVRDAALQDLGGADDGVQVDATQLHVQNLLRHALAETISEGIINCLIITNSSEANIQLTRIHEHLFSRDPTVACVWRRQTFSAAVESCSPEMSSLILRESLPNLSELLALDDGMVPPPLAAIMDMAYSFSRMLHGSKVGSGGKMDAHYKAFVPELGSQLDPLQVELVKRCLKSERGEIDKVGSCVFPGLVKITGIGVANNANQNAPGMDLNNQTVVKRAQVICDCAMGLGGPPPPPAMPPPPPNGHRAYTPANSHVPLDRSTLASPMLSYDRESLVSSPASAYTSSAYSSGPPPPMGYA